jgi:hypothetical protein
MGVCNIQKKTKQGVALLRFFTIEIYSINHFA